MLFITKLFTVFAELNCWIPLFVAIYCRPHPAQAPLTHCSQRSLMASSEYDAGLVKDCMGTNLPCQIHDSISHSFILKAKYHDWVCD